VRVCMVLALARRSRSQIQADTLIGLHVPSSTAQCQGGQRLRVCVCVCVCVFLSPILYCIFCLFAALLHYFCKLSCRLGCAFAFECLFFCNLCLCVCVCVWSASSFATSLSLSLSLSLTHTHRHTHTHTHTHTVCVCECVCVSACECVCACE
jgi:hypothetical protein